MTTPTNPVTPATDEEVQRLRERLTAQQAAAPNDGWIVEASATRKLLARFDAERAARERAEGELAAMQTQRILEMSSQRSHHGDKLAAYVERDEWKARAEKAKATLRDLEARATLVVFSDPVGGMSTTKLDPALVLAFDRLKAQNARMREVLTDRNVYRERDGICCVCMGDCVGEVEYHTPDCIAAELLAEKGRE